MTCTESKGRKVLDTSTATIVGKVDDLLVDPADRRVVAVKVKRKGDQDLLLWSALTSFGPDAVTVSGGDAFTSSDDRLDALAGKAGALLKKRLLTTEGEVEGSRLRGVDSYAVVAAGP